VSGNDVRPELKEYAGGWITERKGTDVPPFLKLSYVVVALGAIAYAILYMNGEVNSASRGALVREFNATTGTANAFMYAVVALVVVFALVLWRVAFSKPHD
jgi:hypothetical protein